MTPTTPMFTKVVLGAILSLVVAHPTWAQVIDPDDYGFDAGSDLANLYNSADFDPAVTDVVDGVIDVPSGATFTLPMPPDGVFNCDTVTIRQFGHLRFTKNELNTPVFILAARDIIIEQDGIIHLEGGSSPNGSNGPPAVHVEGAEGGPGGFRGGHNGVQGLAAGYGHGPGGGAGNGAWVGGTDLLMPPVGGSGGAGFNTRGGAGGGGAILLASSTRIVVDGTITTDGGAPLGGWGGADGSVRLVAAVIEGDGDIVATRVRLDAIDVTNFSIFNPSGTRIFGSYMVPMLPNSPRLDITGILCRGPSCDTDPTPVIVTGCCLDVDNPGDIAIPEGATEQLRVLYPMGSTQDRTIRVVANDFSVQAGGGRLDLRVAVIPDHGAASYTNFSIFFAGGNSADVDVQFPINTNTTVMVWTR